MGQAENVYTTDTVEATTSRDRPRPKRDVDLFGARHLSRSPATREGSLTRSLGIPGRLSRPEVLAPTWIPTLQYLQYIASRQAVLMSSSEQEVVTLAPSDTVEYTVEIFGDIGIVRRYPPGTAPADERKSNCSYGTYSGDNPLHKSIYRLTLGDSEGGRDVYIQLTRESRVEQLAPASKLADGGFKIKGFVDDLIIHDHTTGPKTPLEASANILGIVSKSGEWQGGTLIFFRESVGGRSIAADCATIEADAGTVCRRREPSKTQ